MRACVCTVHAAGCWDTHAAKTNPTVQQNLPDEFFSPSHALMQRVDLLHFMSKEFQTHAQTRACVRVTSQKIDVQTCALQHNTGVNMSAEGPNILDVRLDDISTAAALPRSYVLQVTDLREDGRTSGEGGVYSLVQWDSRAKFSM